MPAGAVAVATHVRFPLTVLLQPAVVAERFMTNGAIAEDCLGVTSATTSDRGIGAPEAGTLTVNDVVPDPAVCMTCRCEVLLLFELGNTEDAPP